MKVISLLSLGMILLLSGCPSAFYAKTQINPQSMEDIAGIENPATVRIERDNNVWGGAIPLVIHDGEKEIGQLGPSGAFEWKREAGYLHLRISETTGKVGEIVGQGHPDDIFYEDFQKPGDTHRFICGIKVDDDVTIRIEPQQEQAAEDIIDFAKVEMQPSIVRYAGFLKAHRRSSLAGRARNAYEQLLEQAGRFDLENLSRETLKNLEEYVDLCPNGKHVKFLEEAKQYSEAEESPSVDAFTRYIEQWPSGSFLEWAKDNLAFTSRGELTDPALLAEIDRTMNSLGMESVFRNLLEQTKEDRLEAKNSAIMSMLQTSIQYSNENLNGVTFSGAAKAIYYRFRDPDDPNSTEFESYFCEGTASTDQVEVEIHATLLSSPNTDEELSYTVRGSWAFADNKLYYYNGSRWVHGLANPFFSDDKQTSE